MTLGRILASLSELSPARALQYLREPWRISMTLAGSVLPDEPALRALFPDVDPARVDALHREFIGHHQLFADLDRSMVEMRGRRARLDGWKEFLYMAVRIASPRLMVETGVFDGESSAVILQALAEADAGELISIDLPAVEAIAGSTHCMRETSLPPGAPPGWIIPARLRSRHRLELGDSRSLLPRVLKEHPVIDVFFHDSLHTLEHQTYEYSTAWPHLRPGGLLLSDDVLWSAAFHRFCRSRRTPYVRVGGGVFGAARKAPHGAREGTGA